MNNRNQIELTNVQTNFLEKHVVGHVADHVSVNVELRFGAVVIANTSVSFYDCMAVTEFFPSAP